MVPCLYLAGKATTVRVVPAVIRLNSSPMPEKKLLNSDANVFATGRRSPDCRNRPGPIPPPCDEASQRTHTYPSTHATKPARTNSAAPIRRQGRDDNEAALAPFRGFLRGVANKNAPAGVYSAAGAYLLLLLYWLRAQRGPWCRFDAGIQIHDILIEHPDAPAGHR